MAKVADESLGKGFSAPKEDQERCRRDAGATVESVFESRSPNRTEILCNPWNGWSSKQP